ncbi:MAG: hypothetical protein GX650_00125 [Clostridiales bacterium]|nr:hypothetical protein [Clostridiales bacterium]
MKKQMLFLLCLLLVASLLPPDAAAGSPLPDSLFGTALMDMKQRVYSIAVLKDAAYIRTDQAFYRWQEGESHARKLADAAPATNDPKAEQPAADILLAWEGRLIGLNSGRGTVYALRFEGDNVTYDEVLQLDWSPFLQGDEPDLYYATPDWAVILRNRLFCRFQGTDSGKELYSFDLTTGQGTDYGTRNLCKLIPYQDDRLLALSFDPSQMDPNTGVFLPAQLTVFEPAANVVQSLQMPLPVLPEGAWPTSHNLYWDAVSDQVYVLSDGQLLRLQQQGAPTLCARLPVGDWWGGNLKTPAIVPWRDDLLLIATESNVFIRSMDESKLPPVTTLTGNTPLHDTNTLSRALQQVGNIQYQASLDGRMDAQAIITKMLTGDLSLDLLVLDSAESDVQRLAAKGYLMDLSQDPVLAAMAKDSLPMLRKLLYHGDGLYAIPLDIRVFFPTANKLWFEELERPLPRTVPELVDLTRWWAEECYQHEDYKLFEMPGAKDQLKEITLASYVNGLLGQGLPLHFDGQKFGAMMELIDDLDTSTFDNFQMGADDEDWLEADQKALLSFGMGYGLQDAGSRYA